MQNKIADSNLLSQEEAAALGEAFHTDLDALVGRRNQCWSLSLDSRERWPLSSLAWLNHCRAVQASLDCWNGGQL